MTGRLYAAPLLLLVVPALFAPELAHAAGLPDDTYRVLPCRPTISCSADLVPPGTLEIEAGYAARKVPPNGWIHDQPILVKLTLLERLQVQVGSNARVFTTGTVVRSTRYLDDISFALKPKLLDQTPLLPSVAVSAALSIPSWDRAQDFPFAYDASFWGYVSKDVGVVHVDLNGGLNIWEFDRTPIYQPFVTMAVGAPLAFGFGTMLEIYDFDGAGRFSPADGGILGGLSYSPRPWLMFDAGADVSLHREARTVTLFSGMTVIPYDFWDTDRERRARAEAASASTR